MRKGNIKELIQGHFFTYPSAKLRVREMERTLRIPLPSAIRYAKELQKEGILERVRIGTTAFYTASRSEEYLIQKRLFNLRSLYASGILRSLEQEYSRPTVVLFGSYGKGEDTEDSDIDMYIETPSKKETDPRSFERILARKIQIFKYPSIHSIENKELANSIINGTVLMGFLEVL